MINLKKIKIIGTSD